MDCRFRVSWVGCSGFGSSKRENCPDPAWIFLEEVGGVIVEEEFSIVAALLGLKIFLKLSANLLNSKS